MKHARCTTCHRLFAAAELKKNHCPVCVGAECEPFNEYSETDLVMMEYFAKGYLAAMPDDPQPQSIDEWQMVSEEHSLDLHFHTNEDEKDGNFGKIEAWGYRRDKHRQGDCEDEVRLI